MLYLQKYLYQLPNPAGPHLITEMYVSLPDRPACHKDLRNTSLPGLFVAAFVSPINKYRKKCDGCKVLKVWLLKTTFRVAVLLTFHASRVLLYQNIAPESRLCYSHYIEKKVYWEG
jgi:hypothetical protein